MAFDDEFVEVAGLGRVEGFEREVVEDEHVYGGDAVQFSVEGVVEAGGARALHRGVHAFVEIRSERAGAWRPMKPDILNSSSNEGASRPTTQQQSLLDTRVS